MALTGTERCETYRELLVPRLVDVLRDRGDELTQAELSELLGVHIAHISMAMRILEKRPQALHVRFSTRPRLTPGRPVKTYTYISKGGVDVD